MKKKSGLLVICGLVVLAIGLWVMCFKEKLPAQANSQSMEQIHQKSGIPVKVQEVTNTSFSTVLKYSAMVRACSEAVAYSRVSDVVQDVLFKVGDYVRKDQTVVTFPKNNQATQYYQLKASYDLAASTYRRMTQLFNDGVISKQEFDNARANYEVTKANIDVSDDSLRVKAELSGYITQLNVKPTDNVKKEEPLFTVSNLDLIEAQIWASSQEVERLKLGQKVTIEWEGKQLEGSISQIGKIMDIEKRAFEVKALFKNTGRILTSGITVDVSIETYYNPQAIMVRRKDMITEGGKRYVYVVSKGLAVKRMVKVGATQGNAVEIKSGLKPGELLVTEGSKMVNDQTKVKIVNS
jgi:membrane fusion protein (multidrug efflux system)